MQKQDTPQWWADQDALMSDPGWKHKQSDRWHARSNVIPSLLRCTSAHLAAKTHILNCIPIKHLTSLGPVFEDWYDGVVNLVLGLEHDHVADPAKVSDLLLTKLDPGIEDAEVELLLKGQLVLE